MTSRYRYFVEGIPDFYLDLGIGLHKVQVGIREIKFNLHRHVAVFIIWISKFCIWSQTATRSILNFIANYPYN